MSARRFAFTLVLAFGVLPASVAQAGFAPTGESIFAAEQTSSPDVAIDAAGNSVVAWADEKILGAPREAKARRLSADGTLGPVIELDPGQIGAEPAVAMTAAGRAFVAWESRLLESDPDSVKGRWIEPGGAMGPILTLVAGKAGEISAAELNVAIGPSGIATVTWRNIEGNPISLRRVQPDGTLGTLLPDISGSGTLDHTTVALPNGSTVAVWRGTGIEMNVVDAALGVGVPLKISSTGAADSPEIAADSFGNALVVWRANMGGNWGAFARLLGPTGVPSGAELTVDPLAAEFINQTTVAADSAGDFMIAWERQNALNEKRVLARGFSAGAGFAGASQPVTESAETATPGAVPALFDSGLGALAWKGGTGTGTSFVGRSIDRAGLPTAPVLPLFANSSFNLIYAASAPAIGVAVFLAHYPISGSAQAGVVRRFLAPPVCGDSNATVVQGTPIVASLSCTGAAIESAALIEKPKHGTLGVIDLATLSVAYTPKPGYGGSDSFTYTTSNDGGSSNVARVTIEVGKDTVKPKIKKLKLIRKGKGDRQRFRIRVVFSEPARAKVTLKALVRADGKLKLRKLGKVTSRKASPRATIAIKGKLARKLRAGGRFRAVAIATDSAGNKSAQKRLKFRVR